MLDGYSRDCRQKRAMYIEKNCELNQEFFYAHPEVKCRINRVYNSSFSGSVLWDFTSDIFSQIVNSWSVSARHMWGLPYAAHKYLIEPLSGQHAFTMLISRYVKFLQSARKSTKIAVQYLLEKVVRNLNTITGKNVRFVLDKTGGQDIFKVNPLNIKKNLKFNTISEENAWRVNLVKELTNVKQNILSLDENENSLTTEELEEIIEYVCIN